MQSAEYWIKKLNLQKHPEGGYFIETYRNDETIRKDSLPLRYTEGRCFSTLIYYLLNTNDISHFHRLKSDEIWHFYTGSSLTVHILDEKGNYSTVKLGPDPEKGEVFHFVIRKNSWFGAEVNDKYSFSLIGCTVTPGFEFSDFELGKRNELIAEFPRYTEIIKQFTIV